MNRPTAERASTQSGHWRLEIRNDIAWLALDVAGQSANVLSREVLEEFERHLAELNGKPLEVIELQSTKLTRLVGQLLDTSRLEAGKLTLALERVVGTLLFGISARDPITIGTVVLLLSVVAITAGYVPARRATRISPVSALRYD